MVQTDTSQFVEQFRYNLKKRLESLWELEDVLADKVEDNNVIAFKNAIEEEKDRILNIFKLIEKGKL